MELSVNAQKIQVLMSIFEIKFYQGFKKLKLAEWLVFANLVENSKNSQDFSKLIKEMSPG